MSDPTPPPAAEANPDVDASPVPRADDVFDSLYVWMIDVPDQRTGKMARVPLIGTPTPVPGHPPKPPINLASVDLATAESFAEAAQLAANGMHTTVTLYAYSQCQTMQKKEPQLVQTTPAGVLMQ